MTDYQYICIEGNIGAGKTTLAAKLAAHLDAKVIFEEFEENSFLPKFYKNPEQFAFPLELSFLADRYKQLKNEVVVKDLFKQTVIADYAIIKSLLFSRKNLEADEYTLFNRFFQIVDQSLPKPDLMVFLYDNIESLQKKIELRGREYEQDIEDSYLKIIEESYFSYMKSESRFPILIFDLNEFDFINDKSDFEELCLFLEKKFKNGINRINK